MWGVGCIFVEMLCGVPTFPGVRDTHDQLDKIFKVRGWTLLCWSSYIGGRSDSLSRKIFYVQSKLNSCLFNRL